MNILKVKRNGQWVSIPAIKGERGAGVPTGGNTGQYLRKHSGADNDTEWADSTSPAWGDITGTLANQSDLVAALAGKVNVADIQEYTAQEVDTLWNSI